MISHLDKSGRTGGFNSGYLGKGSRLNLLGARREGGRNRGQGAGKDEAWRGAKGRSREVREIGRLGDRAARIRLNSPTALLRRPYRWTPRQPKCNLPRRPQSRSTCPRPRPQVLEAATHALFPLPVQTWRDHAPPFSEGRKKADPAPGHRLPMRADIILSRFQALASPKHWARLGRRACAWPTNGRGHCVCGSHSGWGAWASTPPPGPQQPHLSQ